MDYRCKIILEGDTTKNLCSALEEIKDLIKEGLFSATKDSKQEQYNFDFNMDNKEIRTIRSKITKKFL